MKTTVIVAPHKRFAPHVNEVRFYSHPSTGIDLQPGTYATITRKDGSVTRVEYASMEEYNQHKAIVLSKVHKSRVKYGS